MATHKRTDPRIKSKQVNLHLRLSQSPEMVRTVEKLYARYRKHAIPAVDLSKLMDSEMGERTLGEELNDMRDAR